MMPSNLVTLIAAVLFLQSVSGGRYVDPNEAFSISFPAGEYILSNDANFNPNVGSTTEWQRMQGH